MIRKAENKDCRVIATIAIEEWRNTYKNIIDKTYLQSLNIEEKTKKYEKEIEKNMDYLVCEENGNILGYIKYGAIREEVPPFDSEIYAIYVRKAMQNQEIGTKLLEAAKEHLRKQGYKRMITWCLEKNEIGKRFYEAKRGKKITQRSIPIGNVNYIEVAYGYEL